MRLRSGRKSIGRFAVHRSGKSLRLETEQVGNDYGIRVEFDWEEDFKAGTNLNQGWYEIETYTKDYSSSGTTHKIRNLRERWTRATIGRVWISVLFLQPPFDTNEVPEDSNGEFSVSINGLSSHQQRLGMNIKEIF